MSAKLEQVIKKALEDTINHCEFKQAWIPRGWVCVRIGAFAKELAKNINKSKGELK